MQQVPPLDLIGEPYRATGDANVRAGPAADYVTVGHLNKGETVMVAGKVKGQPWYMISQGGAGSGFVSANLLTRAPNAVAANEPAAPSTGVEKKTVETDRTCRTVRQTVTFADKTTREEEVTACQGLNGWEVS